MSLETDPWLVWYEAEKVSSPPLPALASAVLLSSMPARRLRTIHLQALHPFLKSHSTENAELAELFFIPVYSGHKYHDLLLHSQLKHWDSKNGTGKFVKEALHHIKTHFPYWNRTNGMVSCSA